VEALSRGAEITATGHWGHWRGETSYLYADSNYTNGKRIPEVPHNQGSAQLSFDKDGTLVSAGVRVFSSQFDDDLNTRAYVLAGYSSVQLLARRQLTKGFAVSAAFENLLNRTYYVAFAPTPNIGPPRLWRIGLRWRK
jgi:outer membrane receptor protein involved in Fe transport